jgi:CubicO group peptidase (beta-lactamase class C family)
LYHHAAGYQTLAASSPPLDPNCTFELGSAGKFITHLAALRSVEQGLTTLDEPVYPILPELDKLPIISKNPESGTSEKPYTLRPPTKKITLRHLLLHASGIGSSEHPLIQAWQADQPNKPKSNKIVDIFSYPLLFEPGEGYAYGASIYWTDLFLLRLTNQAMSVSNEEQVLKPLGLASSTYHPENSSDIRDRLLQMVERKDNSLVPADRGGRGFVSNAPDMGEILADLVSPSPTLLKKDSIELLFKGQFAPLSRQVKDLQKETEGYGAPAGVPADLKDPPVNWSMAGLVVEEHLPLANLPAGSVTWDGMPNVVWVLNREKGLAMIFATQLIPTADEKTVNLARTFFREAWETFGN